MLTVDYARLGLAPGDSEALAARLRWALDRSDLRQAVGARGRQRVVDQWSWRHTALKTVEQYRLLLDQRSSSASTERRA